jgi:putative transposase
MPRIARVVIPGLPHHITQRGNRRQDTFFSNVDYRMYLRFMARWCEEQKVEIWCYCLMPNHIHLIAVPEAEQSLARAIGEAHRSYTCYINEKKRWKGYLWQGRFSSFPLDEPHLLAAARYIELNPLRGGLVSDPAQYPWSSCKAHLSGTDDVLVKAKPLLSLVSDWREFLLQGLSDEDKETIEKHERTGRPLGSDSFIDKLERLTSLTLKKRKPGPKSARD